MVRTLPFYNYTIRPPLVRFLTISTTPVFLMFWVNKYCVVVNRTSSHFTIILKLFLSLFARHSYIFNVKLSYFPIFFLLKSYFFIYVQKESDVLDFLNDVREIFRSECDSQVWIEALMRPMARALALIGILPSFAGGDGRVIMYNGGFWNA